MALWILAPDSNGACCECGTRTSPCDSCEPNACYCALALPIFNSGGTSVYADVAAAQSTIDNYVGDCITFFDKVALGSILSKSASASTPNELIIDEVGEGPFYDALEIPVRTNAYSSINLKGDSTLTINFTLSSTGNIPNTQKAFFFLYTCELQFIEQQISVTGATSGSFSTTVSNDNEYVVLMIAQGNEDTNPVTLTTVTSQFTVSSSDTMTVNPVIALYVDPDNPSGPPLQLEACPKFELPFGGGVYISQTEAQFYLDNFTSNCVGYSSIQNGSPVASFDATDGGSSLTLVGAYNGNFTYMSNTCGGGNFVSSFLVSGSVNLIAGSTVDMGYTISGSWTRGGVVTAGFEIVFVIRDDNFSLIYTNDISLPGGGSGNEQYTISETGKYICYATFLIFGACAVGTTVNNIVLDGTLDITSNDTISVNPIQALYDNGDNCPSRLDCTP